MNSQKQDTDRVVARARELGELLDTPVSGGNHLDILVNGERIFPPMLEAIERAEREICLETFIYWSGDIARKFAAALKDAAERGVDTYVLLDWWGSQSMEQTLFEQMQAGGVHIRYFNPLRWWHIHRLNFRTHRKILVVDREVAFTGGVGIADLWQGDARNPREWHDLHYRIVGPAVTGFIDAFREVWKELPDNSPMDRVRPSRQDNRRDGNVLAQVLMSSPRQGSETVYRAFRHAIDSATDSILLTTAYFVPDRETIDIMLAAVERGVDFQVLVPGKHMDYKVVSYASRATWGELLQGGVKIHIYDPTMLHVKAMVVDDHWLLIGSANFDNRSFALNDEINMNIFDEALALEHRRIFERDKARGHPMTWREWKKRGVVTRIKEKLADVFRYQL